MKPHWPFEKERRAMVANQIERRGVRDARVLEAFRSVPRHMFIPREKQSLAYEDFPLPIGSGQTISQPYIVALMTELLHLGGTENVLEIGAGSGYQAAILSRLAASVHTVERIPSLARRVQQVLRGLEIDNVSVHEGDGSQGWPPDAPYDAVIVTAAAPLAPPPLLDQLAEGGRLVTPIGDRYMQDLHIWIRRGNEFSRHKNIPVAFVPLRGKYGWDTKDWP